jgi:adenylate kinase family enzyme
VRADARFVVVTGLPGSGKSTVARRIAPPLALELIDKDDFLERLLDREATNGADAEAKADTDSVRRFRLSRRADDDMRTAAEASTGAVLVSFWRRDQLSTTSGTPTEWLRALPHVVELYCSCAPTIAADRFLARRRHDGHGDAHRTRADLLRQFESLAALGPIGVGKVVRVDTEQVVDIDALLVELGAAQPEADRDSDGHA